ncbi:aminodeoxychorismate synthase component I [Thioalkalivibrio sulfidiphilus]|uniref:aminodeoxychorismate synthase component I n=1 Tax=Thioalkalivibrio sulfidiphilus TaxID=1033854 RepID=UPI0003614BD5|nr:aminodeoxychorismate synthase component I [Thioalkalivibrio sulfidiphilus]
MTDLLALHRRWPGRYPHLLESALKGTPQARYSILFAFPGQTLRLDADGGSGDFLRALDAWWQRERVAPLNDAADPLPFRGGWFLFLAYELAAQVEPVLDLPPDPCALPVAFAQRFPCALVVDHEQGLTHLVAEPGHESALEQMRADLAALDGSDAAATPLVLESLEEDEPRRYLGGVERIIDYIREGDVFQVNLSRAWQARLRESVAAAELYDRLRTRNPAPFAALASLPGGHIVSSSPERLVRVRGERVDTRPIAGTRPRGEALESDRALATQLLAHPKERAEHIMLLDLERNDLGRLCVPGSIRVDELMTLETYPHVHHIVSNVTGRLRPGISPGEVIRAVFPGGTITGCPKVRCMEIIAELEGEGRGAYTGSLGYLNRDGDMDLNILIRTLVQRGNQVHFRTGAGIVADSDPLRELEETRHKAEGLLRALRA